MASTSAVASQSQLEFLAAALAAQSEEQEAQAVSTAAAQQQATAAAEQTITALTETNLQLRIQKEQERSNLQGRITVLEQTVEALRAENAALEALRVKHAKIAKLMPCEIQDTVTMQLFQKVFIQSDDWPAIGTPWPHILMLKDPRDCCKPVQAGMRELEVLIKDRCGREIDTVLDLEVQKADTQKLESLASAIQKAVDYHRPPSGYGYPLLQRTLALAPLKNILLPLIQNRKSRA